MNENTTDIGNKLITQINIITHKIKQKLNKSDST